MNKEQNKPIRISVRKDEIEEWFNLCDKIVKQGARYSTEPLDMANEVIKRNIEIASALAAKLAMYMLP